MAGNANSGNVLAFKMSDKELEIALNAYKSAVESGKWRNPPGVMG